MREICLAPIGRVSSPVREVVDIAGSLLLVRGLDAVDGTPVLDIKPYFPQYDRREAETPAWVSVLMRDYF